MFRFVSFVLCVLAGCASVNSPPLASVDVVAVCKELTQASASKPELTEEDFFTQCINAHGAAAQAGQENQL